MTKRFKRYGQEDKTRLLHSIVRWTKSISVSSIILRTHGGHFDEEWKNGRMARSTSQLWARLQSDDL
ncbi:hypothetical protein HZ326_13994 [Fusarium oxysporum f. sp. albedinis]|nr:hypothetical protein HZ326_13994 [Fusarium oxysporum f. sp. albedinis]